MTATPLRWSPLGDRALLLTLGDRVDPAIHARVLALTQMLRAARPAGVVEIVPAYTTIGIWFDPAHRTWDDVAEEVSRLAAAGAERVDDGIGKEVAIPTRYDGPDLQDVAERTGLSVADVIERHAGGRYRVFLLGFVPGFAFLGILDPALVLPRRQTPRMRVPAGSVGIAGVQTAVYPLETPGGWHLIGRTDLRFFDIHREPPALLDVGDRVRFEPVR